MKKNDEYGNGRSKRMWKWKRHEEEPRLPWKQINGAILRRAHTYGLSARVGRVELPG